MNLRRLLSVLNSNVLNSNVLNPVADISVSEIEDLEVAGLFNDARRVIPNSIFVAIRGVKVDGHSFIPEAVLKGARALVVEDTSFIPESYHGIVVKVANTRQALELLATHFYDDPSAELFSVGVTGTNGKTSITYMVEAIFKHAGVATGVIGTVNHHLGEKIWPTEMTTPDPLFLQKRLREFRDEGARAVAMEVSSHALDQHRIDSVSLNASVFSNLTRDHLDYHGSMEKYFEAKQRLFTDLMWKSKKLPYFAIINIDDKWGRRLKVADPAILWTYGSKSADFTYKIISMGFSLTHFEVKSPVGTGEVHLPMSGAHNVMNALASIAVGLAAGIPLNLCCSALSEFAGVPGRLQTVVNDKKVTVFVDYAHTPDALENVLQAIVNVRQSLKSSAKIWTIFGCGGDRDKGKRPLMAQMALKYSDFVTITSDNPRTEDPNAIIKDILTGVGENISDKKFEVIADRQSAIRRTLQKVAEGDVVLIAGKGHEDYQIIGTEKIPFSDFKEAEAALSMRA